MDNRIEVTLKDVEVQKLNVQPGDTLAVTIKSDDVDANTVESLKQGLEQVFPGVRILIFGMGLHDELRFNVISQNKENSSCANSQFCADCTCGKKEQITGGNNG
jgi:hypothetical protein